MKKYIIFFFIASLILTISCVKEEIKPKEKNNREKEVTYQSGIVIKTHTADVDAKKFEPQEDATRVGLVTTNSSMKKNSDDKYYMVFETGPNDLDTLSIENGGFAVFESVEKVIPMNHEYFLIGDQVTVTINIPTYQDVTVYDSLSIQEYKNQNQVKNWNIIDTVKRGLNDTLLTYYDTITVSQMTSEEYTYNNLIFNKNTGEVFNLADNISWSQTKIAKNVWFNINTDSTKVYYTNQNQNIIELDLSSNVPVKKEKFNSSNYGSDIKSIHEFDGNIAFYDRNTERIVTISENSKYDYIKNLNEYMFHNLFSSGSSAYYLNQDLDANFIVHKINVENDTIQKEIIKKKPNNGDYTMLGAERNDYLYKLDDIFYCLKSNALSLFTLEPFSSHRYEISEITSIDYNSHIVKTKDNNLIIFNNPTIYKINLLTREITKLLENYNIFQMEVNQDNSITFYGFSLTNGHYVNGKVDFNGNLEILSKSTYDTSPKILTNIF